MQKETDDQNDIGLRISERLKALMDKRGISRLKLASKIGIREDYWGKMARGKRPWNLHYLMQIANALDVPLDAILGDTFRIPVIAKIGGEKNQLPLDPHQVSFNYRDVKVPREKDSDDIDYVPYPELPKSLAAKTYILEVKGPIGLPELHPGMHLYITHGLGDSHTLKDGDLAIYVNEEPNKQGEHRGFVCRIRWDKENDPDYIYFVTDYTPFSPPAKGMEIKKLAETVSGIDLVVAIVLRPKLLKLGLKA